MTRRFLIYVAVLAFAWQTSPLVRAGTVVGTTGDFAHAVLHWTEAAHHHHGDGDYHQDASSESTQHLTTDHSSGSATLPPEERPHALEVVSDSALAHKSFSGTPPVLEGPLRPPRITS
jgi:hypothetical protein